MIDMTSDNSLRIQKYNCEEHRANSRYQIVPLHPTSTFTLNGKTIDENEELPKSNSHEHISFENERVVKNIRTLTKSGSFNTCYKNLNAVSDINGRSYFADLFTSLCDMNWGFLLFIFCMVYFGSWTIFAILWYILLYIHGDFENINNPEWKPCISDIKGFTESFLFSVETQHTTGYGFYKLGDECTSTIITFCLQSIAGCILEGLMVGFVFAKISRGKGRKASIIFSKNAVISQCQKSNKLCLQFRVADLCKKSNLIHATVRAQLIRKSEDSSVIREELKLIGDGEESNEILLFWPTTLVHEIGLSSPLYDEVELCSKKGALCFKSRQQWEIILILQGVIESTGQLTQARTSYLKSEVILGHSFYEICRFDSSASKSKMKIDYGNFNKLIENCH